MSQSPRAQDQCLPSVLFKLTSMMRDTVNDVEFSTKVIMSGLNGVKLNINDVGAQYQWRKA